MKNRFLVCLFPMVIIWVFTNAIIWAFKITVAIFGILFYSTKDFILNFIPEKESHIEAIKSKYALVPHPNGGYFSEDFLSPSIWLDRRVAGSSHFLLTGEDILHFHQIDCDEIWHYHEGCGVKIYVIRDGTFEEFLIGKNIENGQRATFLVPAGAIFAVENIDSQSYTLVSCVTVPAFDSDGIKMFTGQEILKIYPRATKKILRLTYSEVS